MTDFGFYIQNNKQNFKNDLVSLILFHVMKQDDVLMKKFLQTNLRFVLNDRKILKYN